FEYRQFRSIVKPMDAAKPAQSRRFTGNFQRYDAIDWSAKANHRCGQTRPGIPCVIADFLLTLNLFKP
ncbi:MAG: hypothetical protein ACREP5_11205, partial [Candidatus Binatia bacterium]